MPEEKKPEAPKEKPKKEEPKKNALQKLQEVRRIMATSPLKKTGYNGFSKYNYFQLDDFMPTATKAFEQVGLTPLFGYSPEQDENTGETHVYATMQIINSDQPDESVNYKLPWVSANQSNNPIQNLGSTVTYLRRYLMMLALDLSETDVVDASAGGPEDHSKENKTVAEAKHAAQPKAQPAMQQPKISREQAEKIINLYTPQEIEALCKKLDKPALGEWTAIEAAKAIRFKEQK